MKFFLAISWGKQATFNDRDDNGVLFVLDQHA
jgi:hypothetical protein